MFARMLFPTDLTAYSHMLSDCLPELKAAGLRQVVLLNVIRASEVPMGNTSANAESLGRVRWSREENLHLAQMALEGQGLSARTRVEYGDPAQEIARVAGEERVDWMVMGTEGWNAPAELLLGGTLFGVLRRTFVPMLIMNFDAVRELGHAKCRKKCCRIFARVLYPTDFSDCAGAAFNLVKRLKATGTEEVVLLHVQDRPAQAVDPAKHLEQLRRDLALYGLPAKAVSRRGVPSRVALKVAEVEDASVIVIGLPGLSAFREMMGSGTFEKIVRQSRKPVLVVRETK